MSQSVSLWGASYSNVPALTVPKTGGGSASFFDVSDTTATAADVSNTKYFYTSSGVRTQGTNSGGGGSTKNIQWYNGPAQVTNSGYKASSATITVKTAGTYTVSWTAWRSSSSGTMGTNLHKNSSSGTNQQTFTGTYGQCITLTNQSYNANDVLTIYATSGSSRRTIYISNFIIEQTS